MGDALVARHAEFGMEGGNGFDAEAGHGGEILRECVAERFCFVEQAAEFFLVRVIEGNKKFIELGDGFADGAGDLTPVLKQDLCPHLGISSGHAGGIAQAAAG